MINISLKSKESEVAKRLERWLLRKAGVLGKSKTKDKWSGTTEIFSQSPKDFRRTAKHTSFLYVQAEITERK